MAALSAESIVSGTDSRKMFGDSDQLESLVAEANRSLKRMAAVSSSVDQVGKKDSKEVSGLQIEELIRLLPQEEMEDLARRLHNLESLLFDAPQ